MASLESLLRCTAALETVQSAGVTCTAEIMKLPADTIIAKDKLTRYLLLPQARGDKSGFLAQAGYTVVNADQLQQDLRSQIFPLDVVALESNRFGQQYES